LPANIPSDSYRGDTLRFSIDQSYLFATTRGKTSSTKGLLAVFSLKDNSNNGPISPNPVHIWETPTSGGKGNAIEISPCKTGEVEWIVLTDDADEVEGGGGIHVLEWDGKGIEIVDSIKLAEGTSHAVWLS
jgi:carboxy-cis,cis-muconate cyclase